MSSTEKPLKILIIRLLNLADVAAIGVPALRYFKQQNPSAEFTFLTFSQGAEVIQLAEPDCGVMQLARDQWPEDFIPAMEAFLGLAEQIVGEAYDQIINLDTSFMACFLTRFLKDAGERAMGNYLSISVQELIEQFQKQALKPEYVNQPSAYLESTFSAMHKWFTPWWEAEYLPNEGYPEHFLVTCCGFDRLQMNMSIPVTADKKLTQAGQGKKTIALAGNALPNYPHMQVVKKRLLELGYQVWSEPFTDMPIKEKLEKLAACDLLITPPSELLWLAKTVNCKVLLISGATQPQMIMPDFATDPTGECAACLSQLTGQSPVSPCNCISADEVMKCVDEIFTKHDG
ncbi:glycosyltransferase family 9 protein [Catenovulum sediminis]|uniref:Glycosyltransferase family 9 protein n=1 Tax=Catenovulum sediminis TaxID=1740262 RepID=A0ABV1RHD6_9ALTE